MDRTSPPSLLAAPLALLLLGGCASLTSQRMPDDPVPLLKAIDAPAPSVQVRLAAGATPRQQRTCQETLKSIGAPSPAEEGAAITVEVSLAGEGEKTLTVSSLKRGPLRSEQRPGWWLEDLCRDALATGLRAWAAENGKRLPPTLEEQAAAERKAEAEAARKQELEDRRRAARASRRAPPKAESSTESGATRTTAKKGSTDPWGAL